MTPTWAASAPLESAPAFAQLRDLDGVAVCVSGGRIWLCGPEWNDSLDRTLRSIIGCERFLVTAQSVIVPVGKRLSCGELPKTVWTSLSRWIALSVPHRMFVASRPTPTTLSLVRSSEQRDASLLVTTLCAWTEYAVRAPQARLKRWTFAVGADLSCLIQGVPLPPLSGVRYTLVDGVAVPAGWAWSPALDAGVIRSWLGLKPGELALLAPEGTCEKLPPEAFVAATRSAARLTAEAMP
jgi:hypothetical protein